MTGGDFNPGTTYNHIDAGPHHLSNDSRTNTGEREKETARDTRSAGRLEGGGGQPDEE